jgi:hypothetical protein
MQGRVGSRGAQRTLGVRRERREQRGKRQRMPLLLNRMPHADRVAMHDDDNLADVHMVLCAHLRCRPG